MNDNQTIKIYLNLLEEGSDTIRPIQAIDMGNGLFTLLPPQDYDPEDEKWEFLPGSVVRAKDFTTKKGLGILLAYELVSTPSQTS